MTPFAAGCPAAPRAGDRAPRRSVVRPPRSRPNARISSTVQVAGWASDRNAPSGTGVDQVHLYLDGPAGAGGVGLGVASYGSSRPDGGAAFGSQFTHSGWSCAWNTSGLPPGSPTLSGYARSTASGACWASRRAHDSADSRSSWSGTTRFTRPCS